MSGHSLSTHGDPPARKLIGGRIVSFLLAVLMLDVLFGYLAWKAVDTLV